MFAGGADFRSVQPAGQGRGGAAADGADGVKDCEMEACRRWEDSKASTGGGVELGGGWGWGGVGWGVHSLRDVGRFHLHRTTFRGITVETNLKLCVKLIPPLQG